MAPFLNVSRLSFKVLEAPRHLLCVRFALFFGPFAHAPNSSGLVLRDVCAVMHCGAAALITHKGRGQQTRRLPLPLSLGRASHVMPPRHPSRRECPLFEKGRKI